MINPSEWYRVGGSLIDLKPLDCLPRMFGFAGLVMLVFVVLVAIRILT